MTDPRNSERINRHWIAVQRAGTHVSNELKDDMDKLFREIRRRIKSGGSIEKLSNDLSKIIMTTRPEIYSKFVKDMTTLSNIIAVNAHEQLKAIGSKAQPPKVKQNDVRSILKTAPMVTTNKTTKDLFDDAFVSTARQAKGAVYLSSSMKNSKTFLNQRITALQGQATKWMETIGSTGTNQVANTIKDETFKKAKRKADRVIWASTLDHKTSAFCQAADGKVFPIDSGPRPPAHPRCRSTIVLVGKGESVKELKEELMPRPAVVPKSKAQFEKQGLKTRTGKKRSPSKTDRSPLKGTRTFSGGSYEDWIKTQPKYYQESILGKNATKRLRSGEPLGTILRDTRSSINFDSLSEALSA